MNKLQLYISKSARDYVRLVDINADPTVAGQVADMRSVAAMVDYPVSSKTVFYVVRYVSGGYFIHIIRTIPPTRPYHLEATVFVGEGLDIMGDELSEVIDTVTEKVLSSAVTEADMQELKQLFDREYDSKDKIKRIKASKGSEIAYLRYGESSGLSLDDVIADGVYQPEWSVFKCVVLIDDSLSMIPDSAVELGFDEEEEEGYREELSQTTNGKNASQTSHHYVFALPMTTPEGRSTLEFEVECSKPITRSPIAGYELGKKIAEGTDVSNKLKRVETSGIFGRKGRWIWSIGCVAVGMILMYLIGPSGKTAAEPSADETVTEAVADTDKDSKTTKDSAKKATSANVAKATEATAYLDGNSIWDKGAMEKYDDLRGLFDDMNNFHFQELSGKWADKLAASKNFSKVANASRHAISKKVDPRREKQHDPSYNKEGDTKIGWKVYTYWIDP